MLTDRIQKLKKLAGLLKKEYGVTRIGIFGSYARGEEKENSDIDLLVEFSKPVNLFEFSRLRSFLIQQLEITVDLVTPGALKSMIKENILRSVVYI